MLPQTASAIILEVWLKFRRSNWSHHRFHAKPYVECHTHVIQAFSFSLQNRHFVRTTSETRFSWERFSTLYQTRIQYTQHSISQCKKAYRVVFPYTVSSFPMIGLYVLYFLPGFGDQGLSLLLAFTGSSTINEIKESTTSPAASVVVSPGLSYIGATSTFSALATTSLGMTFQITYQRLLQSLPFRSDRQGSLAAHGSSSRQPPPSPSLVQSLGRVHRCRQ